MKVNSTGTVNIGTGTGSIESTLNLYSSGLPTIYSRATSMGSGYCAIKSQVDDDDANPFVGVDADCNVTFVVKGDGKVWSKIGIFSSDSTLKENFQDIDTPKEKLLKLKGLEYNFKNTKDKSHKNMGFIAQDVEKIFPDLVYTNDQGIKGIALAEIIPIIVEALKEHDKQIDDLTARIEKLEGNTSLEKSATIENAQNVELEIAS